MIDGLEVKEDSNDENDVFYNDFDKDDVFSNFVDNFYPKDQFEVQKSGNQNQLKL